MSYSYSPKTKASRLSIAMSVKPSSSNADNLIIPWPDEKKRIWIASMFIGTMLLYSARSAIPLCMAAMSKDLTWDKEADGAVMSAFFWGYTPAQIVGGYLSDKYGGEVVLGYAAIIWSFCTLAVPFLPGKAFLFFPPIVMVILSRVVTGLSQGLHYPSLTNIIAKRIPLKERTLLTSSVFSAGPVGTLVMGSVGSVILMYFGWPSVFLAQGAAGLLWAWLWTFYLVGPGMEKNRQEISLGDIKLLEATSKERASVPYSLFLQHAGVWATIITCFCQSAAFWNVFSWLPLYFEETYPESEKWVFNVMPWIVFFPFSTVAGLLADCMIKSGFSLTFVRKLFQTVSMCGGALCMLLLDWAATFGQAMFLIMVTMGFSALGNCGCPVVPQDMSPQFAGSLFGLMNAAGAFSGIVIVPISGHILELTHIWSTIFHINAVILIIGCVVFLIFGTAKKIT
ncbi:solute carrier family 17 member 9-like isoform X2 [Nematostella vectensis]|uniref:solute carrier family 17 member 9-like isoform X2 n=1 Tax=Nematostella vectensis TaxID=45351 RepID=UPI00207753CC|nr:solute carrier family 17 member 9-like isoform X2 [Nematostella vectensis]